MNPGKETLVSFEVTNQGGKAASGVAMEIQLGMRAQFVSISKTKECMYFEYVSHSGEFPKIICNFGRINPSESLAGNLTITPTLGFEDEVTITANVSGVSSEERRENNSSKAAISLHVSPGMPGTVMWSTEINERITSRPAAIAIGQALFFTSEDSVYAVDKTTGAVLWRYRLGAYSPPATFGSQVFLGANTQQLRSLDALTGELLWTVDSEATISEIVAGRNIVFFGSSTGVLYSVATASGKLNWAKSVGSSQVTAGSADERHIYALQGNRIIALNKRTGEQVWEFGANGQLCRPPKESDGRIYSATNTAVIAIDVDQGELIWANNTSRDCSWPLVDGNTPLLAAGYTREIHGLDPASGELRWNYSPEYGGGFVVPPIAVEEGKVYAAYVNTYIDVLDSLEGKPLWRFFTRTYRPAISVADGVLYGTAQNRVFAIVASGK